MNLHPPISPRDNSNILQVILPSRVSDPRPGKQNRERSLGDQLKIQEKWLKDNLGADIEYETEVVAGQGSGELVERKEFIELDRLIALRKYDLILTEDLGRIIRGVEAYRFCCRCEDFGVRLISINNGVDTASSSWKDQAFFAAYFYEKDNNDKSKRLKERLMSRFDAGSALERQTYGYIDPPGGAKHESERQKDPEAEPILKEWFDKLLSGASYEEIAYWLNEKSVSPGPYCRDLKWTGKMVARLTHNPILKGLRRRGMKVSRRDNSTGKYKSEDAPPDRLRTRHCPHLAFFPEEYYDRVTLITRMNNAKFKPGKYGVDPRKNRPKRKTTWPGQHVYCGECGRLLRYGAHGQNHRLLCRGAYEYQCWNSISVNAPLAAQKISIAIMDEISLLPAFDQNLLNSIESESKELNNIHAARLRKIDVELKQLKQGLGNLVSSLEELGLLPDISSRIDEIKFKQAELMQEKTMLSEHRDSKFAMPTIDVLRKMAVEAFQELAIDSEEFSRFIRDLIPRIIMYPVRLVDGGHILPRATFQLSLAPLAPGVEYHSKLMNSLKRWIVVDLFDPPQREQYRERVMKLKREKRKEREIEKELGITQTAVQAAAALQRNMDKLHIVDPYQIVITPPDDYSKLRRHQHKRYQYQSLPLVDLY